MEPSRVFADGALAGRVAIVTGGGTNLGKAAAAELTRCGAAVLVAGRRADVLGHAGCGDRRARGSRVTFETLRRRSRSSAQPSSVTAVSTFC